MESEQTAKNIFNVDLDVYEGPFDLLLDLIQKHQIDICDVPLLPIIEDFILYIDAKGSSLDDLSGFMIVAAMLMQIKANSLLPKKEIVEDSEDIDIDPSIVLAANLVEYKKFKNIALELQAKFDSEEKFFPLRVSMHDIAPASVDYMADLSVFDLLGHYLEAISREEDKVTTDHLVGSNVTVEEKIDYILNKLSIPGKLRSTFSELTRDCESKIELIVTFLALLELFKAGTVKLEQEIVFGEIDVIPLEGVRFDVGKEV